MTNKNIPFQETAAAVRHPDYKAEIAALLRGNLAPRQLQSRLEDYHAHDIAAALELLRRDERCRLYTLLDTPTLADVLEYSGQLPVYMEELGIRKKLEILSQMEARGGLSAGAGKKPAHRPHRPDGGRREAGIRPAELLQ